LKENSPSQFVRGWHPTLLRGGMPLIKTTLSITDTISEWLGRSISWLAFLLVLVGVYDVVLRYVFNRPTIWAYETSCMLGATIIVAGWGYVLLHHGHVRVDVFYARMSTRKKAIIDVVCDLLLFFPLIISLLWTSIPWMVDAWVRNEVMVETYWYPPAAPIRTVIVIGLAVFSLQGMAEFIRNLHILIKGKTL
jgi:TRAP-type mannitol/chloroaromatic compound transport system permease small subunit